MCESGKCRVDGGRPLQELLLTAILHNRSLRSPLFLYLICSIPLFIHLFLFATLASVCPYGGHAFHFKPSCILQFVVVFSHQSWRSLGFWSSNSVLLHLCVIYMMCQIGKTKKARKITERNSEGGILVRDGPFSPPQPVQHIAFFELSVQLELFETSEWHLYNYLIFNIINI